MQTSEEERKDNKNNVHIPLHVLERVAAYVPDDRFVDPKNKRSVRYLVDPLMGAGTPNDGLAWAVRKGTRHDVEWFEAKGAENWHAALKLAAVRGWVWGMEKAVKCIAKDDRLVEEGGGVHGHVFQTCLIDSALGNHSEAVKWLIDNGANRYIGSAGLLAIDRGNREIIRTLVDRAGITRYVIEWGNAVAQEGNVDLFRDVVDAVRASNETLREKAKYLQKLLETAVVYDRYEMCLCAIEKGVWDIDQALCLAARKGNHGIVELLLDHGAEDVDRALVSATKGGHTEIMRDLVERGASVTARCVAAAAHQNRRGVAEFLGRLADVQREHPGDFDVPHDFI